MRSGKSGFTLIELLVVIAIIAVLAAILFPVFAQAREASKRAACLNNLRQIGTAAHLYADVWNDHYPPGRDAGIWPMGNFAKLGEGVRPLLGFVKSPSVFYCPNRNQWNRYDD